MSSAISCVVIKTDPISRKTPVIGKLVKVEGEAATFLVVDINRDTNMAQLMEKSGQHRLISVPFEMIRPVRSNLADTIRSLLRARDESGHKWHL